ncbi:MAG: efflux transporter outer membrane subunit [Lysobacterales bacterium]
MHELKLFTIAALSAAIAACTVGPDYVRPTPTAPAHFAGTEAGTPDEPAPAPDAEFWHSFGDALLGRLVDTALLANHDLRIALANHDRADALLRGAGFDRLPTITAGANASDTRASAGQLPGVSRDARDSKSYDVGISALWELDFFGRIRRGMEAQRAETAASAADLAALQVAIVADVVRDYVELRGLQERLRVARRNADIQRETLQLVTTRVDAGRGSDFDTARATAQLEATLARVPALESSAEVAMHRLAVLTGQVPEALVADLEASAPLPALPTRLRAGTPGELLRRRPDVIAAEQRLHAATARIGVATADLFPRFTLGGLIGSQAVDAGALFERDSETRAISLGIDWSFLDVGRVRARIAASDADAQGQLARYQQTVLLALEDTENALTRYAHARVEDQHLERAAIDGDRAAQLARTRYEAGAADLLEVLDAERTQLQAQDAFADARTRSVSSVVALYRAMAGGWPTHAPQREGVATTQSGT